MCLRTLIVCLSIRKRTKIYSVVSKIRHRETDRQDDSQRGEEIQFKIGVDDISRY